MYKNILLILFLWGVVACRDAKSPMADNIQKLVFTEDISVGQDMDLMDSKEYVHLETNKECLITDVTQLFCTSKGIFVFDIYSQSVYLFDYEGNYKRKLCRQGQGPEEYSMISAITVSEPLHSVSVVDAGQYVMSYDIDTFEFIEKRHVEAVSVEMLPDGKYITYNPLPTQVNDVRHSFYLLQYDADGNVNREFLPMEFESGYTMRPIHRFHRCGDRLFFHLPFLPLIYELRDDSCVIRYQLEYERLSYPSLEFLRDCEKRRDNYVVKLYDEHFVYSAQFFENNDFLLSTFCVGKKGYAGIYDKQLQKGIYFLRKDYALPDKNVDYFQIAGFYKEQFVSVLRCADLKKMTGKLEHSLKMIVDSVPEDANPILLFFRLKK